MTTFGELTRRGLFAISLGAAVALGAGGAKAVSSDEAEDFIGEVVGELRVLVTNGQDGAQGAAQFLALLERKAVLSDVAKFAMGRIWRDMTDAQKSTYQEAFRGYISRTYQRRFGEYAGEDIKVTGSFDAGAKGVLVKSSLIRPNAQNVLVEWLVSDRNGDVRAADVIFEGVSLAITLRETFAGMVDKRNGDIDQFIADLRSASGA